jgi:cytochrome b561
MLDQNPIFAGTSRFLHWTMAVMVFAMLFIGVAMVASLADYHFLISIHRPLGIAVLVLVVIRFVNRLWRRPPPLPATMAGGERLAATLTEYLLYALLFLLPLIGWAMLSSAGYPIVLFGSVRLPSILPVNLPLYAVLRKLHTALAYLLFATIVGHFGAVMFHAIVLRDGLLARMAPFRSKSQSPGFNEVPNRQAH